VWRAGARLTVAGSPYLDAHGEEDAGLKRGRPLRLARAVYGALSALWAAGGVDADPYMTSHARVMEEEEARWWT
jgi:allophanate hydrolase subunit 2